ncbi:hypothetical protein GUJ93_ZPchr0010g10260 [Zizania palustris]|uniref:Uncharacterized protein n=1 Tax=Zizania palustris TaxID=103762 RepID=A0A8J5WAV1_ZIZPA|nr:hypothetical protein GUJ93_ZPchr0010g10260 [Zizania palustris]
MLHGAGPLVQGFDGCACNACTGDSNLCGEKTDTKLKTPSGAMWNESSIFMAAGSLQGFKWRKTTTTATFS